MSEPASEPSTQRGLRPWTDHVPAGVEVDLLGDRSLPASWAARWRAAPSKVVLRDLHGTALTGADLEERTAEVAGRLAAAGAVPGDRVLLRGEPSIDHVVAHVAILRLGAVAVPVNPAYTPDELARVEADAAAVVSVVDGDVSFLPPPVDVVLDAASSDDPALQAYTSGTTGAPKRIVLSHGNLLSSAEALRLAWRWSPDDELVLALPLFHMHGLGVGVHGTLHAGASALVLPRFDPEAVLDAVAGGCSLFFGVPTMWHRLVRHSRAVELRCLRLGVSGSAPLPVELFEAAAAACGQPPLERYGMTETVMLVSNPYEGERRAGSVGFPLPGVDVRLGEQDEIEVRGPNVYVDGWFATGDIGVIDDGYLRIAGRLKDLIISGGYNVHPAEVEDVVRSCPGVDDVAVVGVTDDEWGERGCAVVVGDAGVDALNAWCRERLASYKVPRQWERRAELPRNALGKVLRNQLP